MDQPHEISLETISLCNAACTFCPYPTLDRKGDKMPDELVEKIISEMEGFTIPFFFSPFKVNEPLLDKRLYDICNEVTSRTVAMLRIFSNGAALTQRHIDRLAKLERVFHFWVSLNSVDPEEYEQLMDMPYERTAKRLDNLHAQEFPHPVVLSKVGNMDYGFIRYIKRRWPKFHTVIIKKDGWLGDVEPNDPTIPDDSCSRWFELSIISSGVVSLCCMDGQARFPIGDCRESTLLEIYNAPHWRDRRENLSSRHTIDVCKTCTY